MTSDPPSIDPRDPDALLRDVEDRVEQELAAEQARVPDRNISWHPERVRGDGEPDALDAILRAFARMATYAQGALDRALAQRRLDFLRTLGERPLPPRAARAPLTFRLQAGAAGVDVPARTRVADADLDDLEFETTAPLRVSPAVLRAAFVRDPAADRHADLAAALDPAGAAGLLAFAGDLPLPHALHLGGGPLLAIPGLNKITVVLEFTGLPAAAIASLPLQWSAHDGADFRPCAAAIFTEPAGDRIRLRAALTGLPALPPADVGGHRDRWLRAALDPAALATWWLTYFAVQDAPIASPADQIAALPHVLSASLDLTAAVAPAPPRRLAAGPAELDASRELLPFGPEPGFGAVFYLDPCAADDLPVGGALTLAVTASPTPPVAPKPADALVLAWELHTDAGWRELGRSTGQGSTSAPDVGFTDTTHALTVTGALQFTLPAAPRPGPGLAGGAWLRARIVAGDYGRPAALVGQTIVPASFAPPVLIGLTVAFAAQLAARPPARCWGLDDFVARDRLPALAGGQPFPLFTASAEPGPALYLGFDRPLGQVPLALFVRTCPIDPDDAAAPEPADPARVEWESRGPQGWRAEVVDDGTAGLRGPGVVRLVAAPGHAPAPDFGADLCWIRVRHVAGEFRGAPRIDALAPNTVWARHARTIDREVLGSGLGAGGQTFTALRRPLLGGETVQIGERAGLTAAEARAAAAALGDRAEIDDQGPFGCTLWVRWDPVQDLRASGPGDRHYVVDHAEGLLRFGDGVRGAAVPRGAANVRMAYETGGGARGERPAGALTRLRASLPGVAGVTNHAPAVGGSDTEDEARFAARAAAGLRHRGRAVALADLEDLAREASPKIARALALPIVHDPIAIAVSVDDLPQQPGLLGQFLALPQIPAATAEACARAGRLRVIVVPDDPAPRPTADAGLLALVEAYLRARGVPGVQLDVTGPNWVRVDVTAKVVAVDHVAAVGLLDVCRAAVARYLHPLTGGHAGQGWRFGRVPRASDLARVLGEVPGVDHVRGLVVACDPPPPPLDAKLTDAQLAELAGRLIHVGACALTLAGVAGEVLA